VLFSISPKIYCDEKYAATKKSLQSLPVNMRIFHGQVADLLTVFSSFVRDSVQPSLQFLNRLQYDPKMKAGGYLRASFLIL